MEGTLWRTVAVQPAVLVGWQPGASAPGFLRPGFKKQPAFAGCFFERRSQAARWDNDKRAGRSRSAGKYWFLFYCVV